MREGSKTYSPTRRYILTALLRLSPVKEELVSRVLEVHNPMKDDDESESDEEDVRDLSDGVACRIRVHIVHVGRLDSRHDVKSRLTYAGGKLWKYDLL